MEKYSDSGVKALILSLNEQAAIFITTVLLGIIAGAVYDCIKIFRIAFKHNNIFIQLEDGIFWITITFFVFTVMLNRNYGEIRFFNIAGVFLGMIMYIFTVSPIVISVSSKIIYVCRYIINLFFTIITTPIRILYILLFRPIIKRGKIATKKGRNILHLLAFYAKIKVKEFNRTIKIIIGKK